VLLYTATELMRHCPEAHASSSGHLRRQMNRTIFQALYVQGSEVVGARLTPVAARAVP
jgi:hypothetical protein